jgi:hypothetical protein
MPGSAIGICRTCGEPGTGLPFEEWVRPTFTDRSRLTIGEIICHARQFCFTDQNEPLAAEESGALRDACQGYARRVVTLAPARRAASARRAKSRRSSASS